MSDEGSVDSLYSDFIDLGKVLAADPSGLAALERTFPKVLLLASASYLESKTVEVLIQIFHDSAPPPLGQFVYNRSLVRQYHSLFEWDKQHKGVNKFFAYFGDECKTRAKELTQTDEAFLTSVAAFIEIGDLRNQLVHNNYADFQLEKTGEELMDLHRRALDFRDLSNVSPWPATINRPLIGNHDCCVDPTAWLGPQSPRPRGIVGAGTTGSLMVATDHI